LPRQRSHNYVDLGYFLHGFFEHDNCALQLGYLDISTKGQSQGLYCAKL
jgi:hypothetical protein